MSNELKTRKKGQKWRKNNKIRKGKKKGIIGKSKVKVK